MLANLIKHSLRSFKRQRSYLLINILGLSIGLACSLLIALYVINEESYDKFNVKKDRIFRVILNGKIGGQEVTASYTPAVMGPTLQREFPEVEDFLRIHNFETSVVEYDKQMYTESDILEADSSFFNFFTIPVLKGDPNNLLNAPHKAVISETVARKIFGDENPIDKHIKVGSDTTRYLVTGIMSDTPDNCHFKASILLSFITNPRANDQIWMNNNYSLYLLLKPNAGIKTVDAKFPALVVKYIGPELEKYMGTNIEEFLNKGNKYKFFLQNVTDIHFDTGIMGNMKPSGDPKYLIIFGSIAILILVIAAINFMNLATAQASRRAREVGIKKIGGSTRGLLIAQFLTESFILALFSLIVSIAIIKLILPYFNNLLDLHLKLNLFASWYIIPGLILLTIFVGIIAGSYPAFFLSVRP